MKRAVIPFLAGFLALEGCTTVPEMPDQLDLPGAIAAPSRIDPNAVAGLSTRDASGHCYARTVTPAEIETVTEQVVEQTAVLAGDGSIKTPAVFRTVTRQQITRERRVTEFEAVCPEALTPTFVASLQRALSVRGVYRGSTTGKMDPATGRAVAEWQAAQGGPESEVLAMRIAFDLGLAAVPRGVLE